MNTTKKNIVVIGGGFAGLNFARKLFNNKFYTITIVDKNNYNYFTPLLYQVATGFLEAGNISYPFRKLFRGKNINFRMSGVDFIDTKNNDLYLNDGGTLPYDYLVFAAGSKTNFFGNESIQKKSHSLKGIDDALYMRNELIKTLEKASIEKDPQERQKLLTIVIAGGGPTGVEVAGMLAEMKHYIIGKEYPDLDIKTAEIYVVDGAGNLLEPMSDKTHVAACKELDRLGIKVKLNTLVENYIDDQVVLSNGEIIEAKTLIWAAGVTANTFRGIPSESLGRGKRMLTNEYNLVKGFKNIYAIGDICLQTNDSNYPNGHPQLAQPAIQQGKMLARNLLALAKAKPMKEFIYFDRGDMAIIGRKFAVVDLFKHKLHIGGLAGLLAWLFIHVMSLVNYNNIIKTLYNWLIAYLTRDQALRMIFRSGNRESEIEENQIVAKIYESAKN
ncbi:NAD(P)/FAD-dependent oxidoreductase [Chryseobacterium sp. SIMBA_038]|uniref:NAD(P)/FAD-dependent oxidoreductase n=1 Tax=Chryseobacterium sp. SIMBA_038 TaxID=3085780 RepID=UPI00397B7319